MKAFKNLIFIWIVTVGFIVEMYAQDCANLSGIINTYAPVTGISGNVVTVGTTAGAAAPFAVGDYVVLIQMTGIPPVHPGSNMGNYELRLISSISGNSITLDGITKTYSPATEKVQLVRAPHCLTGTVTAKVKAKVWDGSTGGVIALHGGTLTLNANIDATATGFSQAFPPTTVITSSLSSGQGSTDGRGVDGPYLPGSGGGGIGGGGGTGTNSNTGGGVGGGGNGLGGNGLGYGYSSTSSSGVDGGIPQYREINEDRSVVTSGGGGGGVIGGGGGGGGDAGGAGGGVSGGGSSGTGGSGGGTLGVGNGASCFSFDSGGGAGGGSYGGGGGAASALSGGDDSSGGGGGGSWTGGGCFGTASYTNGANGNSPVTFAIPESNHYLNFTNPRIMMGGAGGSSDCQIGGLGGGIIILELDQINGNSKKIMSTGESKPQPIIGSCGYIGWRAARAGLGGAGGGGGGQVILNVQIWTDIAAIEIGGGKGGDGNSNGILGESGHGGVGGAGGGGGGLWLKNNSAQNNSGGGIVNVVGINSFGSVGGTNGASTINPKNYIQTGTGACGGNGLVMATPVVPAWPVASCSISSLTAAPSTCVPATNTYTVSGSITFTDAPATGTLTVSIGAIIQTFTAPFTSPQAYTLMGLTADGASHTVTAAFSDDAACTDTETYTAPVSCQCVISNITATPGACSTSNNTYTLTGQVTFTNAPAAGTLVISVTGGNSVTLTAPFTSPMSYSISNLNADGASHTVTAIFSNDILCTSTQTYTAPAQCSTPCPPSNFNFCTGDSYTLTAPAGYSGYQWYTVVGVTETPIPGAMSNVYVATMPGTYIYRATDAGACAIDLCCPVTLNNVSPLLSCTATVTPACGQSNGSATVTAVGGAGGYTYRWSTSPQQTSATATNLTTGIYTVTVTDSGGCSNTCNVNLAPPNSPTCVASVQSNPGCSLMNGSATVAPSGGNGIYTYRWSTTPAQTAQTATGLGAGTYTVTVTDGNMCSSTCSVTLTTPSGPTCSIAANTQPSCADLTGGSATASGVGGSGSYSYAWGNNMSGATVSGLAGGTYTVTITDSNNCSSTCQVTITTPQNCCNVNAVTIQNIECYDNNTPAKMTDNQLRAALLVTNSNASLTTYNVTVNGGTTITPTSGTYGIGTQFTLGPGTAGGGSTFTVTITDSANPGCQNTVQLVDPGNCAPGEPECPPVKCGTATIQVNGN